MPNLDPNRPNTHVVNDLTYHESEGQSCYSGSEQDCLDFIAEATSSGESVFMYEVCINRNKPLYPSDFLQRPWNSVFNKSEYETIAQNCMVILNRTGNSWRDLTEQEYTLERLKDGASEYAVENELPIFKKVQPYTEAAFKAVMFSPTWNEVPQKV